MQVWKYKNYEEYIDAQVKANVLKEETVWVDEWSIEKCLDYADTASNIICHGTRNGAEQKFFKKYYPDAYVIGTEISHTALKYDMTIKHDFNKQIPEWIEKFDILYSNSFDHAFDPALCFKTWSDQVKPGGLMFLELGWGHYNKSKPSDPVKFDTEQDFFNLFSDNQELVASFNIENKTVVHGNIPYPDTATVYVIKKN